MIFRCKEARCENIKEQIDLDTSLVNEKTNIMIFRCKEARCENIKEQIDLDTSLELNDICATIQISATVSKVLRLGKYENGNQQIAPIS
ncbi:hypothetical protein QE152_g332 [Popillia japonica]|uniref:Uncharacterized protein n=1 Tax=Popillia japonica TaxID=7064 RepID=A0AAW1NF94_POPJA